MKRGFLSFMCGVLLSMFVISTATLASAANGMTIDVGPINIMVNGSVFKPTDVNGNQVPVFVYNGTTYAPLRALAEAYGLEVGYDPEKNLATVNKPSEPSTPVNIDTPYMYNAVGGQKSVSVSWKPVSNVSGYEIHQGISLSDSYKLVKTVEGASSTNATITGLDAGKTYYFKVRAYIDRNGERFYSGFSGASYAMTQAEQGFSLEIKTSLPVTTYNSGDRIATITNINYGTTNQPTGIRLDLVFRGTIVSVGRYSAAPVGKYILTEKESGRIVESKFIFGAGKNTAGATFTASMSVLERLSDIPYVLEIIGG